MVEERKPDKQADTCSSCPLHHPATPVHRSATKKSRAPWRPRPACPPSRSALSVGDIDSGGAVHAIEVEWFRGTVSLRRIDPEGPLDQTFEYRDTDSPERGDYYHVRITQLNGAAAWSSPPGGRPRAAVGARSWAGNVLAEPFGVPYDRRDHHGSSAPFSLKFRGFERYWALARKLASSFGGELKRRRWRGGTLEYLDFSGALAEEIGDLFDMFREDGGLMMAPAVLGVVGQSVLARSDLPDDWTVVANTTQAVRRYVDHYAGRAGLDGGGTLATLAREQLPGTTLGVVFEGGFLLRSCNALVSLTSAYLGNVLPHLGLRPTDLPPGEL